MSVLINQPVSCVPVHPPLTNHHHHHLHPPTASTLRLGSAEPSIISHLLDYSFYRWLKDDGFTHFVKQIS